MNIFAVSRSPLLCCRALDDKRLRKLLLETAQILCTVLNLSSGRQVTPYKNSHAGNTLTLWAKNDLRNFDWLILLGVAMGKEYEHRFQKRHASSEVIDEIELEFLVRRCENNGLDSSYPVNWVNAASNSKLNISFRHIADVHLAYRLYLNARWAQDKLYPTWTRRSPPKWAVLPKQ